MIIRVGGLMVLWLIVAVVQIGVRRQSSYVWRVNLYGVTLEKLIDG